MTLLSFDRPLGNLGAVLSQWEVKPGLRSSQGYGSDASPRCYLKSRCMTPSLGVVIPSGIRVENTQGQEFDGLVTGRFIQ